MKVMKFFALSLLTIAWSASAKVNIEIGVIRNGIINVGQPYLMEMNRNSVEVYRDENTYIEAELISEKDSTPLVKFVVATKNENGALVVRGMPQLSTSIAKGMGMATLQCDGRDERFTLVMAAAKAE